MRFSTDSGDNRKGFKAHYVANGKLDINSKLLIINVNLKPAHFIPFSTSLLLDIKSSIFYVLH